MKRTVIFALVLVLSLLMTLASTAALSPSGGAVSVVSTSGKSLAIDVEPIVLTQDNINVPVWATASEEEINSYVEAVVNANPALIGLFGGSISEGASGTDVKIDMTLINNITDAIIKKSIMETINPVNLVSAVNLSVNNYSQEDFPLTLTFAVDLTNGATAFVLHGLADGTFDFFECIVSNGQISVIVNNLSPFFIFHAIPASTISQRVPLSPQTGSSVEIYISLMLIPIIAGITTVRLYKKRR